MKLTYYGTSAAEGFPGIFCECESCKKARSLGGRNLRSRSQALVDGELLIDFPPDTLYHVYSFGLPLHKIQNLIITHSHADHLYPFDFTQRCMGYANIGENEFPLNIYGSMPAIDSISSTLQRAGVSSQKRWELFELEPYKKYTIGNHAVTPLQANHDFRLMPLIYDIERDGKHLLYANDTGLFLDSVWGYLETSRPYFSLVSLDCTAGIINHSYTVHMNFEQNVLTKKRLIEIGCADENTIFISHHFTHNCGAVYDEFVPIAQKEGFLVSYDGMEIEF